ncbi:MAG: DUF262 domain-containing protein [Planctomycetota bacterium]|nr:MAG: DUF262 domain-containing protein [Planctomycetota bacterium]
MIGHPLKVRELLDEITRGEVLLPEFQRAYVWKPSQVVRLVDSLYRDYPTGQILLWDTSVVPATKHLQGVEPTTRRLALVGRPKIVLDGQQRLTSLYKVLSPDSREPLELRFHLESEQFSLPKRRLAKDPLWVPVREVVGGEVHDLDLLERIAAAGGPALGDPTSRAYLDRLRRLRRIADYAFPIEIFRSDSFEDVTELFVRANSGGTRLRQAELVLAQLSLRLPGTIVEAFEGAIADYEAAGFALDARFLVRALVAVGTGQSRFTRLGQLWQHEDLAGLWERTRRALDRAVAFVRDNARFHSSDWVPSLNALIPLVAFFERNPTLARDVEVGLLRWFYVVSLRSRYSSSPEAALDQDLKAVASERPVVRLLATAVDAAGSLAVDPDELDRADWRNPLFPLTFAAARKARATDWFSGVVVGADPSGEVVTHPIFPKALLKEAGVPRSARDEIANLVFLAAQPPKEVVGASPAEVLAQVAAADPARLSAQRVPLDRSLWSVERYADFLAARRTLLAEALNELLDDPL